jgi:hypothetical protein
MSTPRANTPDEFIGALHNERGTVPQTTVLLHGNPPGKTWRLKTMIAKILPAIVTGLLLATTALASAQTRSYQQAPQGYAQCMAPNPDAYWHDPYAGTYWEGVAPYSSNEQPDPYAGTVWDGVAPY